MGLINLWRKLIYFLAGLLADPPVPAKLDPEVCQCTHNRCSHTRGIGKCHVEFSAVSRCACQIFVSDGGRGDRDTLAPEPDVPTAEDLEKWYRQ